MKPFDRKESIFLITLFLFALGLRLVYLNQLHGAPWFDAPMGDEIFHDKWALAISEGQLLFQGPFFRAPLYGYFLGGIYALFGHSYLAARVVQFLLGSLSVVLVYFLGKRTFDPTVGKVAAVLASVYGVFIFFEGELLIPALVLFLDLILILAVLSAQERPGWWRWLGCGALMGLSAIARPNVLIFLGVLLPWMVVQLRRRGLGLGRIFAQVAGVLLGVALLILPVTVHNYVAGKDLVPIASQGGVNFYIGNNSAADGRTPLFPGTRASGRGVFYDAVQLAQEAQGRQLKPSQVSNYWFMRGLEFMRDEPGTALVLMLKKLALFWSGPEMASNKDVYFFSRWTPLLRILLWRGRIFCPFGIVAPLALAGMVTVWRRKEGGSGLLALFIFSYMISVILFFVNARFRLPIVPFLLPFAGYFLVRLFQERRPIWAAFSGVLILVFGLAVNLNSAGYEYPPADSHNRLGSIYSLKKMYDQAAAEYQQALSFEPDYLPSVAGLARVYSVTGRAEQALELWERAVSLQPDMMELRFQLGFSYYGQGRLDDAIIQWKESARLQPEIAQSHFQLGIAYEDKGEHDQAVTSFRQALQANPQYVLANYNLGHLYKRMGRIDDAVEQFRQAIETNPNFGDAYNSLAWLYAQEKMDLDEGIRLINKALELDENNGAYWDTLAELYIKKGESERAREIFRKMIQREPQEPFWRERLEELGG
jgi:tetratricopeptide (TPR) repeat protein